MALLTFRGAGLLFIFYNWLTMCKNMPFKNYLWFSNLPYYLSSPSSSMYQLKPRWKFFSMKLGGTYPMLIDHSATPFSPIPLPLASQPHVSTTTHTHQVYLHLLINGFKVLWCHIRGYSSQLPLWTPEKQRQYFSGAKGLAWEEPGLQLELCHLLCGLGK